MKIPDIDESIIIDKRAMPLFLLGTDNKECGILICHGYLGSPDDVIDLAKELSRQGYAVSVPRLPGHGTSGRDFLTVSARDWLRRIFDSYTELKSEYKKVIIVGFSLGGILGIIAASVFKPEALVLVAPAITNTKRAKLFFAPLIMLFAPRIRKNRIYPVTDSFETFLKKEYWLYEWPKAGVEIVKLQNEAKKRLSLIQCKTLLLLSKSDQTIPLKAEKIIGKNLSKTLLETVYLEKSRHLIFKGIEKDKAVKIVTDWINSFLEVKN